MPGVFAKLCAGLKKEVRWATRARAVGVLCGGAISVRRHSRLRGCASLVPSLFPSHPSSPRPRITQPPPPAGIVIQTPSDALMEVAGSGSRRGLARAGSGVAASIRSGGPSREGSMRRGRAFAPAGPPPAPEEERGE